MKTTLPLAAALLFATPALAHQTGLPQVHPHPDYAALIALALVVVVGGLAAWRLQAARARKDRRHDPR